MVINSVTVPLFELNEKGEILPNPVFHRSFDYIHSRCVEYPFAASQVHDAVRLLDVGSVKADAVWINWLESLPLEMHVTDYDADDLGVFKSSKFQQADARKLPYPDNHFDLILAVSVIEHIGLGSPQVRNDVLPEQALEGDIAAVAELVRVLKPNGRLVMTFPYSKTASYDEQLRSARVYNEERLGKFGMLAEAEILDYYEYQYSRKQELFLHQAPTVPIRKKVMRTLRGFNLQQDKPIAEKTRDSVPAHIHGKVTWRRINRAAGRATNRIGHIDGLICGVWRKHESEKA